MHDVGCPQVNHLAGFIVQPGHPQAVDRILFLAGAGEQQPIAIRRKRKDLPIQVAGGHHRAAVAGRFIHDPGIAGRKIRHAPRDRQRSERRLAAQHDDLWHRLAHDHRLDDAAGDLNLILINPAVGHLLQALYPRLAQARLAGGQGFVAQHLVLERNDHLLNIEFLAHAHQPHLRAIRKHGIGRRLAAVQFIDGQAGGCQGFCHGAAGLQADLELFSIGGNIHRDLTLADLRRAASQQQKRQQSKPGPMV